MSGNPIQSWILDSTLSIADSGYWIPDSLSAEIVFWIPVVSGILDFLSWITDFKADDSGLRIPQANISCDCGFHEQKFPGIWIPQAKISWILDSTSKNFLDSGFHKQKFPGFWIPPARISRILDSTSQNFSYSELHKQKFPGFWIPQARISRILESRLPYMGRHKDMAGIFLCLFVLSKRDRRPIWEGSIPGRGFPEVISPSQVRPHRQ